MSFKYYDKNGYNLELNFLIVFSKYVFIVLGELGAKP